MPVKLIIRDEVNIKFEGLSLEARKKLTATFKYMDPTARYRPAFYRDQDRQIPGKTLLARSLHNPQPY